MLEEDKNRRVVTIREEIDNGSYQSRRSAYSGKVSSNVDVLVDRVLSNRFGSRKAKSGLPWKKILSATLALFIVLAAIPFVLQPLYGGFESDVVVVLDPDGVRLNETLSINVSIPASYNISSVSVVVPNVETFSLLLVDNSTLSHLWQGSWVVHTLPPGEHIITVRALDSNNTVYSVGTRLTILSDEVPVDNETVPPDTGDGNVPVPPDTGDDNDTDNETVIPPSLNLSLLLDKAVYLFDELVSINGSVLFNNSWVNASVNLSVFGPDSNLSFSLNASNGSFYHEFFADAVGKFVIWANATFGNLSIWDRLDFSVFEDHGYEPEIVSVPVDLPVEIGDKITQNEDVQVILQFTPDTNLTVVRAYLESIGFVPTAEISSSGFIAGVMSKGVYDSIKFNGDILSIYEDQGFTVLLSESLPLVRHDDVVSEFNLSGSGKRICIIDTGVDSSVVNFSYGYDFVHDDTIPDDEYGHGTKVAAIIKSIAPDAELIVAKVIDGSGVGFESDVLEALEWCIAQDPDVISFSIGSVGVCDGFCDTNFVADMANDAVDLGIFVVAASGNDGSGSLKSPACGSNVFSVSATDDFDDIAVFSNVNPTLDMFAPGVDITTIAGSGSGTSFSAPHVSSAALLILENETLSPVELKYRLRSTGEPIYYSYNESVSLNISRLDIYNAVVNNKTMEPYDYSWWWQNVLEGGSEMFIPSWFGWLGVNSEYFYEATHEPEACQQALDGDGNWFIPVASFPESFIIDLGDIYVIDRVRGRSNTGADPINVDIYFGLDVKTFTEDTSDITTWRDTTSFVDITTYGNTTAGRYVKVEVDGSEAPGEPAALNWGGLMFPISIFDLGAELGNATTYYFDGNNGVDLWTTSPGQMNDGNDETYARTETNRDRQWLDSNTCDGTDLGTITQVEVRVKGYWVTQANDIILIPYFEGSIVTRGDLHTFDAPQNVGNWSEWFDITSDTNAPGTWSWQNVSDLDISCEADNDWIPIPSYLYASIVQIRVKFNESAASASLPTVVTNASTFVEETNATLNGYLSSNGSADTTCYFLLNDTNDFGSPIFNLSKGVTTNLSEFNNDTAGESTLSKGTLYYYDTKASNSEGWDESGGVKTFLTKPDAPSSLTAQANSSSMIYLTWSTGTGRNSTYIERNASGETVWARGSGTMIYNGTGTNYEDSGLTQGITYYYQAWSYTNWSYNPTLDQWSDDNDSGNATQNSAPNAPTLNYPINNSVAASTSPNLSITVSDPDGDDLDVTIYCVNDSEDIVSWNDQSNDSTLTYKWYTKKANTTYKLYVNVSDGILYTNASWVFTTRETNLNDSAELWEAGKTYNLSADVNDSGATYGFKITAENITLNGQNYTFDSNGSIGGYGVYSEQANTTVEYCNLTNWFHGIYYKYVNCGTISNNTITNTTINNLAALIYGIVLYDCNLTTISNNTISDRNGNSGIATGVSYGIEIYISSNNIVENNSITNMTSDGTSGGIIIYDSDNTTVSECSFNNSGYGVYIYENSNNIIRNSTITNNSVIGLYLHTTSGNYIYNNYFNNSGTWGNTFFTDVGVNYWNTTEQSGTRIYSDGPKIGGNYWTNSTGTNYSDIEADDDHDGFCDNAYNLGSGNADYLPLSANYSLDETISVTPATWNLGTTTIGSFNKSTGPYFNLSNEGNTALDIQINASNATNATTGAIWVVNDTAGLDNFTIGFNLTSGDTWTLFNYSYVTFVTSLAVSSWQLFDLNITMATMATKHDPLNLTLTFRAVAS